MTTFTSKPIVLASTSKPRQLLLERLQIPFKIVSPDIDESPLPNEDIAAMVQRLAREKCEAVAANFTNALIIGADLVGVLDGIILGKPLTREQAILQLQQMSGKCIHFFIGLCVLDSSNQHCQIALDTYDVWFRKLTNAMIEKYLDKEDVLNCAGSLKIEGLGISLISKLQGNDYTALIGLPLIRLTSMLNL